MPCMIIPLTIGIVLGAVFVVFALQNITAITVTFFNWQIEGSLALILMLTLGVGVFITLLMLLPESIRNYFRYRSLKKENAALAEELRKQKELTHFARTTPPTPDAIAQIENGASRDPRASHESL